MSTPTSPRHICGQLHTIAAVLIGRAGYDLGPPPGMRAGHARALAEAAASSPCERCGGGRTLATFHRLTRRSYRAFAVCSACRFAREFWSR